MRISVYSDVGSWNNAHIPELLPDRLADDLEETWVHGAPALSEGNIWFSLSCRRTAGANLCSVARAGVLSGDQPPLTRQILEGEVYDVAEAVDGGPMYRRVVSRSSGPEQIDELGNTVMHATTDPRRLFAADYPAVITMGILQQSDPIFYARRRPEDGLIDTEEPARKEFILSRTIDNGCYSMWLKVHRRHFSLQVEKTDEACVSQIPKTTGGYT